MAAFIPAAGSLLFKGLGSLFGRGARRKATQKAEKGVLAQRTRGEELRSARAGAGAELLRGLGSGASLQGKIRNPFGGLTPEMLAPITRQMSEKELRAGITPADVEAARGGAGQQPSFLGGLMGGAADFLGRAGPGLFPGGGAGAGAGLPGGPAGPPEYLANAPYMGGDQPAQTIDWEAIMRQTGQGR